MGDLIDVDMDALEGEGVIRVSNADYLRRPLRLDSSEAVRADRRAAGAARGQRRRRPPDRGPHAGQARGGRRRRRRRWPRRSTSGSTGASDVTASCASGSTGAVTARRQVRLDYYVPSRDESTERVVDPLRAGHRRGQHLPRRVVPPRRGPAALPARPDLHGRGARHPRAGAPRPRARATSPTASSRPRPTTSRSPLLLEPRGALGRGVLPDRAGPPRRPRAAA